MSVSTMASVKNEFLLVMYSKSLLFKNAVCCEIYIIYINPKKFFLRKTESINREPEIKINENRFKFMMYSFL